MRIAKAREDTRATRGRRGNRRAHANTHTETENMAAYIRNAAGRQNGRVVDENAAKADKKFGISNATGLGRKPLQALDNLASALSGRCNVGGKGDKGSHANDKYSSWSRQPLKDASNDSRRMSSGSDKSEKSTLSRLLEQRSRQAKGSVIDIDSKDKDDPQAVAQYAKDIYDYFKEAEPIYCPTDYMNSQVSRSHS